MKRITRPLFFVFAFVFVCENTHGQVMQVMKEASTPFRRPLTVASNEATKKQLALARAEGDSVDRCISWLVHSSGSYGGTQKAGEYKVSWMLSPPEGWYTYNRYHTEWVPPSLQANAHLWVFVQDGADGRIVPPLSINAEIKTADGKPVLKTALPYAWMPLVNGYGNNIQLPVSGNYILVINIDPPAFHRHDPYNGDRFTDETHLQIPVMVNTTAIKAMPLLSETMEAQKHLAKGAGKAYANTLKNMYKQANDGRDIVIGDYHLAFAVEYAEGFWDYEHGDFRYKVENDMSGKTNAHVEVAALDAKTGRFLDRLDVTATLLRNGKQIGTMMEHFMWHPWLYHYGDNWRVPSAGVYDLKVHIEPPAYRRYGKTDGRQFTRPLDYTFTNIKIKTGQK